jgi:hypothetical protein
MRTRPTADVGQEGPEAVRLWRLRRRHDYIDAIVWPIRGAWELQFVRNGRVLLTRQYETREVASADADGRLRELQRAGWHTHW